MGLISALLGGPTAPLRGVVAVAEQVRKAAEDQYFDPVLIRRELEAVARMRDEGELSDEEATAWEDSLVERLVVARDRSRKEQR